jgi:hypothetical protein
MFTVMAPLVAVNVACTNPRGALVEAVKNIEVDTEDAGVTPVEVTIGSKDKDGMPS